MTGDQRQSVTRRRLLASLGTVGIAGGLAGSGTAAVLSDRTAIGPAVRGGALDLAVDWRVEEGPGAGTAGSTAGPVAVPIAIDGSTAAGAVRFRLSLTDETDRGALWVATGCPSSPDSRLARAMAVRLEPVDPASGTTVGPALASGSLAAVASALRDGRQLTAGGSRDRAAAGCRSRDGGPLGLRLRWSIDGYVGRATTRLPVRFAAVQCRHVRAANPFDGRGGCGGDPCPCCRTVGSLVLDGERARQDGIGDRRIAPGTYRLGPGTDAPRLRVTETVTDAEGRTVAVAGRLVFDGGRAPALCRVDLAGVDPAGRRTYRAGTDTPLRPTTTGLSRRSDGLLSGPTVDDAAGDPTPDPGSSAPIRRITVGACARRDGGCE